MRFLNDTGRGACVCSLSRHIFPSFAPWADSRFLKNLRVTLVVQADRLLDWKASIKPLHHTFPPYSKKV